MNLSDSGLACPRCIGCGSELPFSTPVETYATSVSLWIIAKCKCGRSTPFRLEEK